MAGEVKSGGFVTENDAQRTKYLSMDTNDSASSRYSTDSQKPRTGPPPETYHVLLPKEQIYRVPPPENAHRFKHLSRQKPNRSNCRRCFCSFLAALLILLVLAALVAGIIVVIYRPQKPRFSVTGVSVAGINLTSSSPISPVMKIKVRYQNRNGKLGLVYEKGIGAEIFYEGIKLGNGEFTAFKQPAKNETEMETELRGWGIQLSSSSRSELTESKKKQKVPFELRIKAPVQFKLGYVTTWTMTVVVDCEITVDKLTPSASVITESCDSDLSLS